MRNAKIVCTLGPATTSQEQITALARAGMNIARINASHGSHAEHEARIDRVREAAKVVGRPIGVLVDLQGPKIRLGVFVDHEVQLNVGDKFTITTDDVPGTKERVSTTYKGLPGDCRTGDIILIDDGKVAVRVDEVTATDVVTSVQVAGPVSDHKGVNLPGVAVSLPAMTDKDEADLRWGLQYGADLIALSFVRSAKDIEPVHRVMDEENIHVPVIAKIEKPQAVENLDEIVEAFDGIMVARGDLGVELPPERVPLVQKHAITLAREHAKPVILATQVLESMTTNPRPTRAEASDAANAVLDGADALMLSGETSVGLYPTQTVATMATIIGYTEDHGLERIPKLLEPTGGRTRVITNAAVHVSTELGVKALVVYTETGFSARQISRLRPRVRIVAMAPTEKVRNQLALLWGVMSYNVEPADTAEAVAAQLNTRVQEIGVAQLGDNVVVVEGFPMGKAGTTNMLQVLKVGDEFLTGTNSKASEPKVG